MHASRWPRLNTPTRIALGLAFAALGMYGVSADDAPGAPVGATVLMAVGLVCVVRALRHRLPPWAGRTVLAVGVVVAASVAFLTHRHVVTAPLFAEAHAVPSATDSSPSPQYARAVDRARALARAAILEQNLPGVSVAVGADDAVVWAEGFGWRDIVTRTPVTPRTRFNIGTAASAVIPVAADLGLTETGADEATEWSPEQIGEPGEDFPPLAFLRRAVWSPIGLMPAQPLADERATFYVPRADDNPSRGRRLMYMRDLACCADGMAFSSTPSDLVRVAMATTHGSLHGDLAGGAVMSIVTRRDRRFVVVVTSNIAYAKTEALAVDIADAFAELAR